MRKLATSSPNISSAYFSQQQMEVAMELELRSYKAGRMVTACRMYVGYPPSRPRSTNYLYPNLGTLQRVEGLEVPLL